jgi:hypothetical protein
MKLRMLLLAVFAVAIATTAFGVPAQPTFNWAQGNVDYENDLVDDWYAVTYCDEGVHAATILAPGTKVVLYQKNTPAFVFPDPTNGTDAPCAIGEDGANNEIWPTNEWTIDDLPGSLAPSFFKTGLQFLGEAPDGTFYLVIMCCDENGENCVPMYFTPTFIIQAGYSEVLVGAPDSYCGYGIEQGWNLVECCTPPIPQCVPSDDWSFPATGIGYHTSEVDYYPDNVYECLDICADHTINLTIGPLRPWEKPVISILSGCDHGFEGCFDDPCLGATFEYDPDGWVHSGELDGSWTNTVTGLTDGCICLVIDDILPVELSNFDAIAGDKEVKLAWSTASETDIDEFEIMRDGELVHVEASGNTPYNWIDSDLNNGRTYSYELVSVNISGIRTVIGNAEATPSFNAATITEYALHQNFPNPFNPTTSIVFDVVEDNHVTLTVYNAMGQEVATLVNGVFGNGRHNVEFSSDNLTSGLYFYTVKIGSEFTATKKMLLVK